MRIAVSIVSATQSILIFLSAFVPPVFRAAETREPVFIKTNCQGKISSAVLSELRAQIGRSQKYRVVERVEDEGRMDAVLALYMNCTERDDIIAIATVYGKARCLSANNCHLSIDASSISSDLCDPKAAAECGRELFKALYDYDMKPNKPPLVY